MTSPPPSRSAQQIARQQGLARMSAVTLGISVASVLGTLAIATTLPGAMAGGTKPVTIVEATRITTGAVIVEASWSTPQTTVIPRTPGGPRVVTSSWSR